MINKDIFPEDKHISNYLPLDKGLNFNLKEVKRISIDIEKNIKEDENEKILTLLLKRRNERVWITIRDYNKLHDLNINIENILSLEYENSKSNKYKMIINYI